MLISFLRFYLGFEVREHLVVSHFFRALGGFFCKRLACILFGFGSQVEPRRIGYVGYHSYHSVVVLPVFYLFYFCFF